MLNSVSFLVNSCFKDRIGRGFYIALWPATKNGSIAIIQSTENHGECPDMPPRQRPDRIFTVPRLCTTFGGTSSVLLCYGLLKPSETTTGDRCRKQLKKLSSSMTLLGHMSQNVKTYLGTLKWEYYPTRRTLQTLLLLTTICLNWWHTAWLISISAFMK